MNDPFLPWEEIPLLIEFGALLGPLAAPSLTILDYISHRAMGKRAQVLRDPTGPLTNAVPPLSFSDLLAPWRGGTLSC